MMMLKQSTAVDVLIGPFVDLTDGATAETGESPTVKLSKNGQTLATKNDVTTPTHDADGYYNCELDATDTNTVGTLVLTVAASANALPVRHEFQIVEEATYDFLYASGATPIADINAEVDTALTDYDPPTRAELTSDINSLNDLDAAAVRSAIGLASANLDIQLSTIDSEIGTIDGIVDAILVDTGTTIPAQISGLNDLSAAQVNAEVDTALADIHLDHLLATDYDPASKPGTATALLNELVESDGGVSRFTINALEQAPSGSGASAAAIADAVWAEALADHSGTAGSTAEALDSAGGSGASASAIADAVWDEAQSGHATAGTFGEIATEIASILVDTGTTLPATLSTVEGKIDTVDTVVDGIQTDLSNGTDGLGAIKTAVDATPTATENADALLNRDMSAVSDSNSRSPLNALRFLRNRFTTTGGTLTVYEEDDSSTAWTSALTTNAAADPVTGSDPD